nr:hypothetical protein [Enhygromyxa salina]
MIAEVVHVALFDVVIIHPLTGKLDPVRAAEILDVVLAAASDDSAVPSLNVGVLDRQIRELAPATDHELLLINRVPVALEEQIERSVLTGLRRG